MRKTITNSIVVALVLIGLVVLVASLPVQAQSAGPAKGPKPAPDPAIAYTDNGALMVMNADGTNKRAVLPKGTSANPDWSPDGRRLVFAYTPSRRAKPGVYVINLEGSGLCQLAPLHGGENNPVWSPVMIGGSEWIIYVDNTPPFGSSDLFAVRADCSNPGVPVNLTNTPRETEQQVSLSRFSNRLAAWVSSYDRLYLPGVAVYDVVPSPENGVPQLANRILIRDLGLFQDRTPGGPSWAKNDDHLMVLYAAADPNPYGHYFDLWVSDLTVSGTYRLTSSTEPGSDLHPNFAPSGNEVVFEQSSPTEYASAICKLTKQVNPDGTETWVRTKLADSGFRPKWRRCDPCR